MRSLAVIRNASWIARNGPIASPALRFSFTSLKSHPAMYSLTFAVPVFLAGLLVVAQSAQENGGLVNGVRLGQFRASSNFVYRSCNSECTGSTTISDLPNGTTVVTIVPETRSTDLERTTTDGATVSDESTPSTPESTTSSPTYADTFPTDATTEPTQSTAVTGECPSSGPHNRTSFTHFSFLLSVFENFERDSALSLTSSLAAAIAPCPAGNRLVRNIRVVLDFLRGDIAASANSLQTSLVNVFGSSTVNISANLRGLISGSIRTGEAAQLLLTTRVSTNVEVDVEGAASVVLAAMLAVRFETWKQIEGELVAIYGDSQSQFIRLVRVFFNAANRIDDDYQQGSEELFAAVRDGIISRSSRIDTELSRDRSDAVKTRTRKEPTVLSTQFENKSRQKKAKPGDKSEAQTKTKNAADGRKGVRYSKSKSHEKGRRSHDKSSKNHQRHRTYNKAGYRR